MTTDTERAVAGARLLDESNPGWFEKIDAATLDISLAYRCVLGQLYGDYGTGVRQLQQQKALPGYEDGLGAVREHGFTASTVGLNQAWREEIAKRRLATIKPEPVAV